MKTGDIIHHKPSGEHWVVAWADEKEVCCCGWPETIAKREDCELLKSCSEEKKIGLLQEMKHLGDTRGSYARAELATKEAPNAGDN